MSNMLEQAIIDATALKEAAIKNAETAIIEHYSEDIKTTIEKLLEQTEDPMADPMMDPMAMGLEEDSAEETEFTKQVPYAATDGGELGPGEDELVEINFDDLQAKLEEETPAPEEMFDRETEVAPEISPEMSAAAEGDIELQESFLMDILNGLHEEIEIDESDLEEALEDEDIEERVKRDTPDRVAGRDAGGRRVKPLEEDDDEDLELEGMLQVHDEPEKKEKEKQEKEKEKQTKSGGWTGSKKDLDHPYKRDDKKVRENKNTNKQLLNSVDKQKAEIRTLKEEKEKYRSLISEMKEKMNEINLSNAKLFYTNRILKCDSLNERQKHRIVEAVSNAGTVEETKTIFDTLQNAVGGISSVEREPKSLSEVVMKRSSAFLPRKEQGKTADPFAERMKVLAGINK